MPATQQDNDDELRALRRQVLEAVGDFRNELIEQRKMVQRGFEEIARGQVDARGRILAVESDVKALRASDTQTQQRLAHLESESIARRSVLQWLLLLNLANAVGWLAVVGLLIWLVMRLFSLTG